MKKHFVNPLLRIFYVAAFFVLATSCNKEINTPDEMTENNTIAGGLTAATTGTVTESILLAIDEESIDNGNQPNNFSEVDVNDHIAKLGQRQPLSYFRNNVGKTIDLFSGEVGDEGWHAIKTIPSSWISAGPTASGSRNYLLAGPGLGGGEDGPENFLDKIPNVTPLRAKALKMLEGKTVLAVVYDGDVSTNYDPLTASLKGETLGRVALQVIKVTRRTDGSSGSLPRITVKIVSVDEANAATIKLFSNAPAPRSSSEPFDINPPAVAPVITLVNAN
jgi:hypothetical protein